MSNGIHRDAGLALERLERLLDTQQLARLVPHLPSEAIHQLVRHKGVEGCGELLAAATPAQLAAVLDADLWRNAQAGRDERFDVARFGEWVEGLMEGGEEQAALIVARMSRHLVIAGLAGHLSVFDLASLSPATALDGPAEHGTVPFAGLAIQIGGYVVRAKTADTWEAIVGLLVALEAGQRECFDAVMRGCRLLSDSTREVDGLDNLLMAPEQLLLEMGIDREDRRTEQGYLSPADARAFLQSARQPRRAAQEPQPSSDPIAAAYLEPGDRAAPQERRDGGADVRPSAAAPALDAGTQEVIESVGVLLAALSPESERPRGLLAAGDARRERRSRVHEALELLRSTDEGAFLARNRELAFLANALMAGCSLQARAFSVREAYDAAAAACSLGLELGQAHWPQECNLLAAFRVGWSALHEASVFVAERLIDVLKNVRSTDSDTLKGLNVLRRVLQRQCKAGTPWGARDALDVLASLDTLAWTALLGLLDECPVLPEALPAILEHRTGAVSATAFTFVASADQLAEMRAFGRQLAEILSD